MIAQHFVEVLMFRHVLSRFHIVSFQAIISFELKLFRPCRRLAHYFWYHYSRKSTNINEETNFRQHNQDIKT